MPEYEVNDDHFCFACGSRNPDGLRLLFDYPEPGACRAEFTAPPKFQGWQGILHGGIIATLLDEAFAHAAGGSERAVGGDGAVTAEMTVQFKRPVPIGKPVVLTGRVKRIQGRLIEAESELTDASGTVLASAQGKIIKLKKGPARP